jgi:hypothetical protein
MSSSQGARRPDKTHSKHIKLTGAGREKIEAWAQQNGLNFSAAIETLALLGLDDERSGYVVPAIRATTLQGIRLAFNRIARLLSDIAIESAAARTMSEGVMLQLVRLQAAEQPDDFETVMRVYRDGRYPLHDRIRAFHDDIKNNVAQEAVRRLKKPVAQVHDLLTTEDD